MNVILASASKYRRQQLEQIGLRFQAISAKIDEDSLKDESLKPQDLCELLAKAKAKSLQDDFSDEIIIGCDQLVQFQSQILGKAHTVEKARAQLKKLSGQTHELITSMHILYKDQAITHTDITRLTMRPLSDQDINDYVMQDQPLDCAGSYKLEKAGISLFQSIQSEDHSAIIGIPLIALTDILLKLGHPLPFRSQEGDKA